MMSDAERSDSAPKRASDHGLDDADLAASLAESLTALDGLSALAPGVMDLVASAAAKVLGRSGARAEATGVDIRRTDIDEGTVVRVRIDCHLDDSRSVAEVVDEIHRIVEERLRSRDVKPGEDAPRLEVDLRVISRGRR